jgi:AcrR family transcriptional regulator
MKIEELYGRKAIIDAALEIYIEQKDFFTIRRIAERAEVSTDELRIYYPNKTAILKDFYAIIPDLYKVQTSDIEGYRELPLADKLSNYIYTTFDILQEHRDFVEMTFKRPDMGRFSTTWKEKSSRQFMDFVDLDSRIPDLNRVVIPDLVYDLVAHEYFEIVAFWLNDESQGSEKSLALVDKMTAFIQEVLYSGVINKGFDLVKYVMGQDIWKSRIPNYSLNSFTCDDFESRTSQFRRHSSEFFKSFSSTFYSNHSSCKSESGKTKTAGTSGIHIQVD